MGGWYASTVLVDGNQRSAVEQKIDGIIYGSKLSGSVYGSVRYPIDIAIKDRVINRVWLTVRSAVAEDMWTCE